MAKITGKNNINLQDTVSKFVHLTWYCIKWEL